MWRKFLAIILLVFSLALAGVLIGAENLARYAVARVVDASGLELSYSRLDLDLYDGRVAVADLLLIDSADGKTLLSIGQASLDVVFWDLLRGDNSSGELSGRDVDIYLYLDIESDADSDRELGTWLGYRNLLPGTASIDALKLHWRTDDPGGVTHFVKIRSQQSPGENITKLEGDGFHRNADLRIEAEVAMLERIDGDLDGVSLKAMFSSQHYETNIITEGSLEGSREALGYHLKTEHGRCTWPGAYARPRRSVPHCPAPSRRCESPSRVRS